MKTDYRVLTVLLTVLTPPVACGGEPMGATTTDTDTSSSSSTTDAGATTSAPTTTDASGTVGGTGTTAATGPTTTGDGTTGTTGTTGDGTTGTTADATSGTTTGDSTTGGVSELCAAYCDRLVDCVGAPLPMCVADCEAYDEFLQGIGPVCGAAADSLWTCGIGLECPELLAFADGQPSPCDAEAAEVTGEPPPCVAAEADPPHCTAFCEHAAMCMVAEPDCLIQCKVDSLVGNAVDPACGAAVVGAYACLDALDCQQLMNPMTCLDEISDADMICPP